MATPQIPVLFLSHSGAQKDFTRRLYHELIHVNHNPFFDQDARDSLPRGEPFPSRIVEACRACKLGIVVVSHEYIESLWPMLELHQLLFHNPSSPNNVYPVFYQLKPADLSKEENLARWWIAWERQAPSWHAKVQDLHMVASTSSSTSHIQPMLDISSWPKALQMLRHQSGDILFDNKDVHAFIQTVVRNICNRLPPPNSFLMADHFKGAEHIQQEIQKLYQQQESIDDPIRRMPIAVGIYGVGGSGKTTVCKYMLNFYSKVYLGSCCFLPFPSREGDESHLLVKSMKEVLEKCGNYTKESLDKINNVEQAMPHLQELLKRYKVFLVLDNVWDWALPIAHQIVTMDYISGSKLLVTARSERLLQKLSSSTGSHINEGLGRLPAMQIVHVPSISEEEAVEALMAYSLTSWQYATNVEDLQGLARLCFFDKQCHPLLLKAMGAKLRHLGGHTQNAQDWTQLISCLQAQLISCLQARHIDDDEEIEVTVLNVLKTSFDGLHSKLQDTFLNLGTCIPLGKRGSTIGHASGWLSMLSSQTIEEIRHQLIKLEYHGLIQIDGVKIVIHDLQRMLIENVVREKNGAPRCFLFEGGTQLLAVSEWTRLRYIYGYLEEGTDLTSLISTQRRQLEQCFPFDLIGCLAFDRRATSPNWPNIEVLCSQDRGPLFLWHAGGKQLSVKYMQSLRYLELMYVSTLKELGGWHGAPNLVSVTLSCCRNLQKIESVACLRKLESLVIQECMSSGQYVTNFSSCENLKRLVIERNDHLKHLAILGHLPQLQELRLGWCRNLVDVGTLSSAFPSLQRCHLENTGILNFPICNCELKVLHLGGCHALKEVKLGDGGLTSNMEELDLEGCSNLDSIIPDVKQLVKLRKLCLGGCHSLKELGDAALTSLEILSIQYNSMPIHAFTNLRCSWARIYGDKWEGKNFVASNLPVSLEALYLKNFKTAEEIAGLSGLVNLKRLHFNGWPSLTKITGLGSLTKLQTLDILECGSLREVGYWEAPFISNLEAVQIWDCGKLETLSTMRHLPSLKDLYIGACPMLQVETVPQAFRECFMRKRLENYETSFVYVERLPF